MSKVHIFCLKGSFIMGIGNIREIVSGFKSLVGNIPTYYDNFDEVLDSLLSTFGLTMNKLLPMKHFAISESRFGRRELNIFDSAEFCKDWVREVNELCADDGVSCKEIPFSKFVELAQDELENPNCYSCEPDRVVVSIRP